MCIGTDGLFIDLERHLQRNKAIHANCDKDGAKFKGPNRKVALL